MGDILLTTINAKWIHPSLALRLLKANLEELEERATILEFALRQPLSEKIDPILRAQPRILGISVYIWNHLATVELLTALRAAWAQGDGGRKPDGGWMPEGGGGPLVVLGGPEASHLGEDAVLIGLADVVVRGEGEVAFRDLCRSFLAGRDPVVNTMAANTMTAKAKSISADSPDVNILKRGYGQYTAEDLSSKLCYVEASRGCPFGCEFCLSALDRSVRLFPLEEFLADMDDLIQRGGRSFKFLDRTFNLDIPRAIGIMEFFLSRARPSLYTHFEMVPSLFPQELRNTIEKFAPGSLRIEMGIQTFNIQVARTIGRSSDPGNELEVLSFLRERTNAIVHADLIAGLPGETLASLGAGFDALWSVRPTEIQLGMLKRLPGTPITRHDSSFGMRYSPEPPYEVIETAQISAQELGRVRNFARFWELIVNRGHFNDLLPGLLTDPDMVFDRFMVIADSLYTTLGRNWGIPRDELRSLLMQF